jgi:hypothetical protein
VKPLSNNGSDAIALSSNCFLQAEYGQFSTIAEGLDTGAELINGTIERSRETDKPFVSFDSKIKQLLLSGIPNASIVEVKIYDSVGNHISTLRSGHDDKIGIESQFCLCKICRRNFRLPVD